MILLLLYHISNYHIRLSDLLLKLDFKKQVKLSGMYIRRDYLYTFRMFASQNVSI